MNKTPLVEKIPRFEKQLKKLGRKHPGFKDEVQATLCSIAMGKHPTGDLLPGYCATHDVFKVRIGLGNAGKSSGARIIYCWDGEILLALYVYAKNDILTFTSKEVQRDINAHRQNRNPTI